MTCPCGCDGTGCTGGAPTTPLLIDNAPGQPELAARIGTFSSFRRTMLEALAERGELGQLTTRDPDDPSISLVEQAAAVADTLTFYTERYANESYLGTATQDLDVRRLVGLIGYRPAPGLSATTTLCLALETGAAFIVAAGFGVQSVPGPGEQPQDFETLADLAADARLNALPARPAQVTAAPLAADALINPPHAASLSGAIAVGAPVLLVRTGTAGHVVATNVAAITNERERIRLTFAAHLGGAGARALRPRRTVRPFGVSAPAAAPPVATADSTVPGGVSWSYGDTTDFALAAGNTLTLDRVYDDLPVGASLLVHDSSWTGVVTVTASVQVLAEIKSTASSVVSSGPATRVTVTPALPAFDNRRTLSVIELAGELPVATTADDALGTAVWVPGMATTTDDGTRAVAVAGALGAPAGPTLAPTDLADGRAVVLTDAAGHAIATSVDGTTRLEPSAPADGAGCFLVVPLAATADELTEIDPSSMTLLGNAVVASHGKTVAGELVGSADATLAFQRFTLAKAPLTRVASATIDGSTPALTLRVDGLSWPVVDELLASGPRDETISLRTADDGKTIVQFGDGEHGARPRSGSDNVEATYRFGAGLAGRVRAGALTNAATRPPGFRSVVNPVAAEGGADPEPAGQMRERAPATVRVFGRAVSAADYADLLLAEGTVAKARSAQLWDGHGLVIAVTVAGQAGGTFSAAGLATLAGADKSAASPYRRVVVGNHVNVPLRIELSVAVAARADTDTVLAAVRSAVLAAFEFDAVSLGGHVPLSQIYRVAQPVSGVETVTVTKYGYARPSTATAAQWATFLTAHGDTGDPTPEWLRFLGIRIAGGTIAPAELATLADADLTISATAATAVFAGGLE